MKEQLGKVDKDELAKSDEFWYRLITEILKRRQWPPARRYQALTQFIRSSQASINKILSPYLPKNPADLMLEFLENHKGDFEEDEDVKEFKKPAVRGPEPIKCKANQFMGHFLNFMDFGVKNITFFNKFVKPEEKEQIIAEKEKIITEWKKKEYKAIRGGAMYKLHKYDADTEIFTFLPVKR